MFLVSLLELTRKGDLSALDGIPQEHGHGFGSKAFLAKDRLVFRFRKLGIGAHKDEVAACCWVLVGESRPVVAVKVFRYFCFRVHRNAIVGAFVCHLAIVFLRKGAHTNKQRKTRDQ